MLDTALKAAAAASDILIRGFGELKQGEIDLKGQGDYVTALDKASEAEVIRIITSTFPTHHICAEESGGLLNFDGVTWVIDPLDGTANYVHGIPLFAVSIAAMKNGELLNAVIAMPMTGEVFSAEKGSGAWCNGKRLSVSPLSDFQQAVLATAFPWRERTHLSPFVSAFRTLLDQSSDIRRMGAAAVDLAYTAAGKLDGYYEMGLNPWDIAAGILLVEEAGGRVTDFNGAREYWQSGNIVAGPANAHDKILSVLKASMRPS